MDIFTQALSKGNMIGDFWVIGDIIAEEIIFTSNSEKVFEKVNAITDTIHGLSDVIKRSC